MSQEEKKVVELAPLGKFKRILLFLGDYFIAFIFSFILFNLAVFPLAKVICQTNKKAEEIAQLENNSNDLLISSGILMRYEDKEDPTYVPSFDEHVNYTFKVFLSYYAFDEETPDSKYVDYGHKESNEVIKHYYVTYMHNVSDANASYLEDFKSVNEDGLFAIGETVSDIKLKDDYKELLATELLEVTNESKYSANMKIFRDKVFARLFYLHVYKDIQENDFTKEGYLSYNQSLQRIGEINNYLKWVATWPAIISAVLSWGIVYLLYPMLNGERRTMTMSVMKLNKLKMVRMVDINRKDVALQSFYNLLLSMSSVLFLPVIYFGFAYCFNLPLLFIITLISLILTIVSLFFILFNEHNRSGSDILTFSVVVPTSEIDNIYKEKLEDERSVSSQGSQD